MAVDPTKLPKLLPGEEIVNVQEFEELPKGPLPSEVKELEQLANATRRVQIGNFGPVMASRSLASRTDTAFKRYEALFGRDSLRVALDMLDAYPKLARNTILVLGQLQGVRVNDASEEEPGRIPHEVRDPTDPIAQDFMREYGWEWPYYGSVDATPEYIRLLSAYCTRTKEGAAFLGEEYVGRENRVLTIADSLVHAVRWITSRLATNTEGLLEFKRRNPRGIENQVWKDSWDSYFHADGTIANHKHGIASVEVQRVAYDALLDAADLYERYLHKEKEAEQLRAYAAALRHALLGLFWTDDKDGYFVLGLDRDEHGGLHQLKVRTSNMGHLLHSRLLMDETPEIERRREILVRQLFSGALLSLNGVRTLASDEVRFRPGAYHNGSCWGWDNYMIAQGLDMHGYAGLADYLKQMIIDGITNAGRYVEFLRGSDDPNYRANRYAIDVWDDKNQRLNRLEQPPQDMQAWTVAAVYAIKLERRQRKYSRLAPVQTERALEREILLDIALRNNTPAAS